MKIRMSKLHVMPIVHCNGDLDEFACVQPTYCLWSCLFYKSTGTKQSIWYSGCWAAWYQKLSHKYRLLIGIPLQIQGCQSLWAQWYKPIRATIFLSTTIISGIEYWLTGIPNSVNHNPMTPVKHPYQRINRPGFYGSSGRSSWGARL